MLGAFATSAIVTLLVLVFELARASVPQHRAALERLVRAQTGLDVRFAELGLRWGWYGPEAVFRDVELDEPGSADALVRAPELVVGFDAWRTLRSGHPEAGRIELVAPEIDFARPRRPSALRPAASLLSRNDTSSKSGTSTFSPLGRVAVLQRWRGGRIDIDGGTLRVPGPPGTDSSINLQIRRAALRRQDDAWNMTGLLFLPERVGRSARISLDVRGDLGDIRTLAGTFHLEARRMQFSGLRSLLADTATPTSIIPDSGGGDLTLELRFAGGRLFRIGGTVHAAAAAFSSVLGAHGLVLDRVRAGWQADRLAAGWRVRVSSIGSLEGSLCGVRLSAAAGDLSVDWQPDSTEDRLRASGRFNDLSLAPAGRNFVLGGLSVQLAGSGSSLLLDVGSRNARLDWPGSRQPALSGMRVASSLRFDAGEAGWQLSTDGIELEHGRAALKMKGRIQGEFVRGASVGARIAAAGTLSGADVPLVMRLLNDPGAVYGAVASRLKSGQVQSAEFALNGPLGDLPATGAGEGFTGSLTLRRAALSGGDLWPDAENVDARVQWRGSHVQASVDGGRAGPFQLNSATVVWDTAGISPTRLAGRVAGRLEDALGWIREHPDLLAFAPGIGDLEATGDSAFDVDVSIPADRAAADQSQVRARIVTSLERGKVRPIDALPPLEGVTGSFVFDSGQVQRSVLTGSWLGGPVTLRVGERRDRGARAISVQAQGAFDSRALAAVAGASDVVKGSAEWTGELVYRLPPAADRTAGPPDLSGHWRLRADSGLLGIESRLPEPFRKRAAVLVPAHVEVSGYAGTAQLKASLGDRVRALLALRQTASDEWRVERGALRFGGSPGPLPDEPVVLIRGHLTELDFPAYALAWTQLRQDLLPSVRADLAAERVLAGGQVFDDVAVRVERTSGGTDLLIDSTAIAGMVRWPGNGLGASQGVSSPEPSAADIHLVRLELPPAPATDDAAAVLASLGPKAHLQVDELRWHGRTLGRLIGELTVQPDSVTAEGLKLSSGVHEANAALRCRTSIAQCRLAFRIESSDAAETLLDFGLSADVTARSASLSGDLGWQSPPDRLRLAGLHGTISLSLADGAVRSPAPRTEPAASGQPFALLAVPALIRGLDVGGAAGNPLTGGRGDLRFAQLSADFEVADGSAVTSNLHFDGDAEILMRGRTGLLSRDYDQEVWILRGEDRLPAPVRRFGATPRVAAAWLSLRDLFSGGEQRAGAVLHLQGSWDDPMVVPES